MDKGFRKNNYNYRVLYAIKCFDTRIQPYLITGKPLLSMPILYFLKRGMFMGAYLSMKQNWVLRKYIDWDYDKSKFWKLISRL